MEIKRISTEDGSDSLYVAELDETYHSIHGAIQESSHVFIKNGLEYYLEVVKRQPMEILEYGFGTGLNALLSLKYGQNYTEINYTSLEKFPIDYKSALELNYGDVLHMIKPFEDIIKSSWGNWQLITSGFQLRKLSIDFRDYIPDQDFDLIYFDAFAPGKQPELWSIEILKRCYDCLRPNGIFVTYSAKGQLRRDLQSLGFSVERLPGPPGKFEMIRAIKPN